jgi:hypothetical protein
VCRTALPVIVQEHSTAYCRCRETVNLFRFLNLTAERKSVRNHIFFPASRPDQLYNFIYSLGVRSMTMFITPLIASDLFCYKYYYFIRFEVFTAVTMKNAVLLYVTPCGSCKSRRFVGT